MYFRVCHLYVVMFQIEYHSKSVADSLSFVECWASRWLLKYSIALDRIDFFQKEYMIMQDI